MSLDGQTSQMPSTVGLENSDLETSDLRPQTSKTLRLESSDLETWDLENSDLENSNRLKNYLDFKRSSTWIVIIVTNHKCQIMQQSRVDRWKTVKFIRTGAKTTRIR